MKILELELEGFASYKDLCVLDLSNIQAAVVVGENGAGKSSLFDAMLWCLYGETSAGRAAESIINSHSKEAAVKVKFEDINGGIWEVERARNRSNKVSAVASDKTGRNYRGATPVTNAVKEALGVDAKVLCATAFAQQGAADMFTSGTPDQRRTILQRAMRHLHFGDMANLAKEEQSVRNEIMIERKIKLEDCTAKANTVDAQELLLKQAEDNASNVSQRLDELRGMIRMEDGELATKLRNARQARADIKKLQDAQTRLKESVEQKIEQGKQTRVDLNQALMRAEEADEQLEAANDAHGEASQAAAVAAAAAEEAPMRLDMLKQAKMDDTSVECFFCGSDLDENHIAQMTKELTDAIALAKRTRAAKETSRRSAQTAKQSAEKERQTMARAERQIEQLKADIKEVRQQIQFNDEKIERLRPVAETLEMLEARAAEQDAGVSADAVATAEKELKEAQYAVGKAQRDLEEAVAAVAKLPEVRAEALQAEVDWGHSKLLAASMQPSGIQQIAAQQVAAQIGLAANMVLADMSDLRVRFLEQSEAGKDLPIEVKYQGTDWRPYATFSGGERLRVDVALRVGLCETLNVHCKAFLLDEGWGALDHSGALALGKMLHSLVADGRITQVFTVTHMSQAAASFSQRIEISKENGSSVATVVDDLNY